MLICLTSSCQQKNSDQPAPGDTSVLPGTHSLSLIVDNQERTYLLFVPECYTEEKNLPLVLMFHGGGGSAIGVSRDTGWSNKAEDECLLVVYPDGLPEERDRPATFSRNPRLWNDGSGRFNQDVDDVVYIRQLLAVLQADLKIDPKRIFAAGFSNGASMTFFAAIEMEGVFAAVAPVAGSLWINGFQLDKPVSLLYLTGTEDPLNPMEGGPPALLRGDNEPGGDKPKPPVQNHINSWVKALNCNLTPEILEDSDWLKGISFNGCREGTEVQFYTLIGAGHHWPGGIVNLPEIYVGKKIDKLNAVDLIWDFFKTHPKP